MNSEFVCPIFINNSITIFLNTDKGMIEYFDKFIQKMMKDTGIINIHQMCQWMYLHNMKAYAMYDGDKPLIFSITERSYCLQINHFFKKRNADIPHDILLKFFDNIAKEDTMYQQETANFSCDLSEISDSAKILS